MEPSQDVAVSGYFKCGFVSGAGIFALHDVDVGDDCCEMEEFVRRVDLPVSAEIVFAWHEEDDAFDRLNPPWEKVKVIRREGGIKEGASMEVKLGVLGPFGFRAKYRHGKYDFGRLFVDEQEKGPFRFWRHMHRFIPTGPDSCVLEDAIEYEAPMFVSGMVRKRLAKLFDYRHEVTLLAMHKKKVGVLARKFSGWD